MGLTVWGDRKHWMQTKTKKSCNRNQRLWRPEAAFQRLLLSWIQVDLNVCWIMFLSLPFLLLPMWSLTWLEVGKFVRAFTLSVTPTTGQMKTSSAWNAELPCHESFQHIYTVSSTPAEKFSLCCLHRASAVESRVVWISQGWQRALETNVGLLPNFDLEQWGTRAFQRTTESTKSGGEWESFSPKNKSAVFSTWGEKEVDNFGLKHSSKRALPHWRFTPALQDI